MRSRAFLFAFVASWSFIQDAGAQPVTAPTATAPTATAPTTASTPTAPTAKLWSGCVDRNNPEAKIKIGEPTYVCLNIGNGVNWGANVSYTRVSFKPQADQYSRLQIPRSFSDLVVTSEATIFSGGIITVGAAAQDGLSFLRVYYNLSSSKVYPFLTAIIAVDQGSVTGITWDDACVFCGPNECEEDTFNYNGVPQNQSYSGTPTKGCYFKETDCNIYQASNNTICDLTLYVVWTGTDSRGVAFQSSAYRFSQFPPQQIQDRIMNSLPTVVTGNLPSTGSTGSTRELTGVEVSVAGDSPEEYGRKLPFVQDVAVDL